ncbi:uncharacterized protein A4U43_C07F34340 [Asparagus officinalis]|uniref:Major facilitator superfamily (MFS) profile domain-containing protein n=1 Tax=Asparagus officinalis TaxID=4686 RepID=A0A5P1EHF8_ASPOF|nr:uncharacterized protein A4U43_C07F34340 [Asparagus officinalis]
MEGGVIEADASAFRECFSLAWKNPFVWRLAFSAGIGGLLFGYDTGVISGALLYIRDDFSEVDRKTWLQEIIVSMAVAGAIIGAAIGGWANDRFGRKLSILVADALFFTGAVIMALDSSHHRPYICWPWCRIKVGVYIRCRLTAKILDYTETGYGPWNMEVDAWDRWNSCTLAVHPHDVSARIASLALQKANEVDTEIQALQESVASEIKEKGSAEEISFIKLWKTKTVRRGLLAGVGLQIFQQFVGINTVMYYSPTIVQLAGFASNQTALALSLVTSGLNAIGSIVSIYFIDRTGRKKLLIISLTGVVLSLAVLTAVFQQTTTHSPAISAAETAKIGSFTCPAFQPSSNWDCMHCLKASSPECGFCASSSSKLFPGACWISNSTVKDTCHGEGRLWYTRGCPSRFGWLALVGLALYIIFFSPGMGTVPWIVNSEIYPLRFRGVCGGIAATANWVSNLIVAQSFLSLTETIGTSWTFLIFGVISLVALFFVIVCVPETKGLPIEEVEAMLDERSLHWRFWSNKPEQAKRLEA